MSDPAPHEHEHTGKGVMCVHVLEGSRPLAEVHYLPDGTWDFMCGHADHSWDDGSGEEEDYPDAVVVCAECTLDRIVEAEPVLSSMKRGSVAERRSPDGAWDVRRMSEQELAECFDEG